MTRSALIAWILALPTVNHVPRPVEFAIELASFCIQTDAPTGWAALLDTFAALESGYNSTRAGDCDGLPPGSPKCRRFHPDGKRWAHSCGYWQTPCPQTPDDPAGQFVLAVKLFTISGVGCPEHPLALYAKGVCVPWKNGEWRERIIARALLTPWAGEATEDSDGLVDVEHRLP